MPHDELFDDAVLTEGAALDAHLDTRVDVYRIIVDEHGTPTGQRIYRGSFQAPPDWQPPTAEQLIDRAKKGSSDG